MVESDAQDEEWSAALAHATRDKGLDLPVRRWVVPGLGHKSGAGAVWYLPGDDVRSDDDFPEGAYLEDANAPANRDFHHRIFVRPHDDLAVLAGRLRHELEHARQYEALHRTIFDLYSFIKAALAHRVGGLDGCAGHLINAIPAELDANAAAAMHLREHHRGEVERICRSPEAHVLACSRVGPEPFHTLPARMLAFAFIHRGLCEEETRTGMSLAGTLDDSYPGASRLWAELQFRSEAIDGRSDSPASRTSPQLGL